MWLIFESINCKNSYLVIDCSRIVISLRTFLRSVTFPSSYCSISRTLKSLLYNPGYSGIYAYTSSSRYSSDMYSNLYPANKQYQVEHKYDELAFICKYKVENPLLLFNLTKLKKKYMHFHLQKHFFLISSYFVLKVLHENHKTVS